MEKPKEERDKKERKKRERENLCTRLRCGKFSVLMSLYRGEKAVYFNRCMESLFAQTLLPAEIIIVLDGEITKELWRVLDHFRKQYPELIKIVPLSQNRGLGVALAKGIVHCSNELVARMDTDDIARPKRFEKQIAEFKKDGGLDILGGYIREFSEDGKRNISIRRVPLTQPEIERYQRQRSAFNHVTVMYKKSAVLRAGNYQDVPLMEDSFLWVRMLKTGAKCKNMGECLVDVRAGDAMIKRRGGYSYFKKYRAGRKKILETGYISRWDYNKTVFVQAIVAMIPKWLRKLVYIKLLR